MFPMLFVLTEKFIRLAPPPHWSKIQPVIHFSTVPLLSQPCSPHNVRKVTTTSGKFESTC